MTNFESSPIGSFFLVVPPGLEEILIYELSLYGQLRSAISTPEVTKGGVGLEAPIELGLELNHVLKTPTRILMRMTDFGCRDFPKLFKKMSQLPWDQWIDDQVPVDFQVSSTNSRLKIKKRIEETCLDARKKYLKLKNIDVASAKSQVDPVQIYIRIEQNICTVSLDTSGDRLHKRGYRKHVSEAPIRESLASALVLALLRERQNNSSGESAVRLELADPMMGGGTLLFEGARLFDRNEDRQFAYENTLLNRHESKTGQLCSHTKLIVNKHYGFELDQKTLQAAKKNFEDSRLKSECEFICEDFFSRSSEIPRSEVERWVIANPPYGERIQIQGPIANYYEKFFRQIDLILRPDRVGIILSNKALGRPLKIPKSWMLDRCLKFSNGGLPVTAMLWSVSGPR